MHLRILAVGKPSLAWAKSAVEDYHKRIRRFGRCELEFLRPATAEAASRELLARSEGALRIALDERGERFTTRRLADWIGRIELQASAKTACFLVGGADGHDDNLRSESDLVLSLSPLTLQHELALVVLLEQLFRVRDLQRGGPYHRD